MARPTPVDVDEFAALWQSGLPISDIAERLNVPASKLIQLRLRRYERGDPRFSPRRLSAKQMRTLTLALARRFAVNPELAKRITGKELAAKLDVSLWAAYKILSGARMLLDSEKAVSSPGKLVTLSGYE